MAKVSFSQDYVAGRTVGVPARLIMASALALGLAPVFAAPVVTVPYVDRFEAVATDANVGVNDTIMNSWGGHQPRITRHADGTVRIAYLYTDRTTGTPYWRLMKRAPTTSAVGTWAQEAIGPTTDDVGLLRDARDDSAYVVTWPNSVPTVYASSSSFKTPVVVPGSWQVLPAKFRQYGNFAIGADGTICVKASRELANPIVTSQARTEYACGKYTAATKSWTWGTQVQHLIGLRHGYDYLFVSPKGIGDGLYGVAQRDLYKTASNVPLLDPSTFPYVYNGNRAWRSGLSSDASWAQTDSTAPIAAPTGATKAPAAKLIDSYVDSKGRTFTSLHKEDPTNSSVYGTYLTVTSPTGVVLYDGRWPTIEIYGNVRYFEDAKGRQWLMWTNRGTKSSQFFIYPVKETAGADGKLSFTLGAYTDVGKATLPYALDGVTFLAAPRGGNPESLYVDAIMNACTTTIVSGVPYDSSTCHNVDGKGLQSVFYMRIRLPD
ncbi:hypothetical protein GTP46_25025 [Duganella sp. FT135W]|uniref:Uncharacterized protein n=1 Tax=Duganella flavida TaxID=2692175 RepID=A0A6L8KER3_9BURK|nr:hypothetical protein [Duganella flavida]MYM25896.1 hypothetical protein [Duganella flavida]